MRRAQSSRRRSPSPQSCAPHPAACECRRCRSPECAQPVSPRDHLPIGRSAISLHARARMNGNRFDTDLFRHARHVHGDDIVLVPAGANFDRKRNASRRREQPETICRDAAKSRSKPEPPHFTTFFTGQPRLMSIWSKPSSSVSAAAFAITLRDRSRKSARQSDARPLRSTNSEVFGREFRVSPSALVNSVMIRPHEPSERITRRKTVSVTPAIGARIVAGRMAISRILSSGGNILFMLLPNHA